MHGQPDPKAVPAPGRSHQDTPYDDRFYDQQEAGSLASARAVAPIVAELVGARSVIDVGCGRGTWLKAFREHGAEVIRGLDGAYVAREKLLIDPACFSAADLTGSIEIDRRYDLAVCLEVAEHLPARSARALIGSLVGAAPVVLFSAAVPGQGGTDHVNEQWPAYWMRLFAELRYERLDVIRPLIWRRGDVAWWYRQNLFLYATEAASREIRSRLPGDAASFGDDLELVGTSVIQRHQSFRGLLGETRRAAVRAIRSRLARLGDGG